jgi:hypothetical protein
MLLKRCEQFMRIFANLTGIMIGAMLTGCSSGVMQLGPDSYRASAEGMSLGSAESDVMSTAASHCAHMGRQVMVQSIKSRPSAYATYAAASVNFQCLAAGDPGLGRVRMQQAPSVVIENRTY